MIPKVEITLLAATDKAALFNIGIASLDREESHSFNIHLNQSDEISGKKRMMEFVNEILAEFVEEFQRETRDDR